MPFDTTRVIPEGWSRHHTGAAAGGMNARVIIGELTGKTHDPATDQTTATWSTLYSGPARIQALNQSTAAAMAGQDVKGRSYLVQLDFDLSADAHFTPGLRVKVAAAANDAQLVDEDLWLVDPQLGSERFTRDLVCSDDQTDAPSQS